MGEISVRLYRPGDEAGITALFREVFAREMTLGEWRWKYLESYPPKVYASVAVHAGQGIVGHYGGLCLPMVHRGAACRGLSICDVMIRPQFRGIRLLKELARLVPEEAIRDGIRLGFGFPNSRNLLSPGLHLGIYEKVEDVLEGEKEVGGRTTAQRFIFKFFPLGFDDERIDRLWEECSKLLSLSVVRNRDYLRWRYQRHPLFSYELWGLRKRWHSNLLGLAVLRRDGESLLVVDFLCRPGLLEPLLVKAENYARGAGDRRMALWFPEYLGPEMGRIGFSVRTSCTSIPRTTCEPTLQRSEIRGNFFYTMGDTDFL